MSLGIDVNDVNAQVACNVTDEQPTEPLKPSKTVNRKVDQVL